MEEMCLYVEIDSAPVKWVSPRAGVTKKMDLAAPGQEVSNELYDAVMSAMLRRKRKNLRIYQHSSHSPAPGKNPEAVYRTL